MARKDRAPNPPKRPQGPQRRTTPRPGGAGGRGRAPLYGVAAALLAAAITGGILLLRGGGGGAGDDVPAALRSAGCTYRQFPAQERGHTTSLVEKITWNSSPPTNGMHYQVPAVWGAYEEPLDLKQVVHNLEHGGVYVLYGSAVPASEVRSLQSFYDDDPRGLVLAPLPSLKDKIALGVWTTPDDDPEAGTGRLALCPGYDESAFKAFRDEYRFKAPERFPPDSLQPGT